MKILNNLRFYVAISSVFFISMGANAVLSGPEIQGFPYACRDATLQTALQGHVLRAGTVYWDGSGWAFSFPDHYSSRGLQTAELAQNAGITGLNYDDDEPDPPISPTPPNSFVIAQILVGDPNSEPVVTCVSPPLALNRYTPERYLGSEWSWLQGGVFAERLKWKRFHRWNWKRWWGNNYFRKYRRDYGRFREVLERRRFHRSDRDERRWDKRRDERSGDRRVRPIRSDDDKPRGDRFRTPLVRPVRDDNDTLPAKKWVRPQAPVRAILKDEDKPMVRKMRDRDRDDDGDNPNVRKLHDRDRSDDGDKPNVRNLHARDRGDDGDKPNVRL